MIYARIHEVSTHIEKHHATFAGESASKTSSIIENMYFYMRSNPAVVGFTFEARTKAEYGSLDTWITINKLEDGWEMIEQIRQEE